MSKQDVKPVSFEIECAIELMIKRAQIWKIIANEINNADRK